MLKLTIQDNNDYTDLFSRYFEDIDSLEKYIFTLIVPVKNNYYKKLEERQGKIFSIDLIKDELHEDFEYFRNGGTSMSATIMNGEDSQSIENIGYEITTIETLNKYVQPLAWGAGGHLLEVFPKDYRELDKAFDEFLAEINLVEDCVDSYRIGLANSPESMKEYGEFISCCGSTDIGVTVNDTLYMFGCNYGH